MRPDMSTRTVLALLALLACLAAAPGVRAEEGWRFSLTPYIWASGISEDLTVRGRAIGGNDTTFPDLVDLLDTSFQLHFEGLHDRWGLYADITWVELSDDQSGTLLRTEADIKDVVGEVGALFRPGGRDGPFSLLFGLRALVVDERYRLTLGPADPVVISNDDTYYDAMVGVRYNFFVGERWLASLAGDFSTGDTDFIWTAQALGGWRWGARRQSAILFGYRYRQMQYEKADAIEVDKTLGGPIVGFKFGF